MMFYLKLKCQSLALYHAGRAFILRIENLAFVTIAFYIACILLLRSSSVDTGITIIS